MSDTGACIGRRGAEPARQSACSVRTSRQRTGHEDSRRARRGRPTSSPARAPFASQPDRRDSVAASAARNCGPASLGADVGRAHRRSGRTLRLLPVDSQAGVVEGCWKEQDQRPAESSRLGVREGNVRRWQAGQVPDGSSRTGPEGGVRSRMCSVSRGGCESPSCDVTSPELVAAAPGGGSGCRSSAVRLPPLSAGGKNEVLVAPLSSRPCGARVIIRRTSATRASEQLLRAARRRRTRDRQGGGCVYLRRSPYLRALRPPPAARRAPGELRLRQRNSERLPSL